MSALYSLAGIIKYDNFVSSAEDSRRIGTVRVCLTVIGINEINLPLFCWPSNFWTHTISKRINMREWEVSEEELT